ncbi:hypothetical protein EW145_g3020 [Phellinidium pouzarii]|uniref:HhH-GPD domain-containing protein n=1 Tax=Phellinidium pouzarii TaxID=167371 RepID=A0A4S4LAA0_9AGAM|nr:hypothetical protein EW145_g3020 [Phellinidium pouzarii]
MPVTRSASRITRQSSATANAQPQALGRNVKSKEEKSGKNAKRAAVSKAKGSVKKVLKTKKGQAEDKNLNTENKSDNDNGPELASTHVALPLASSPAPLPAVLTFSFADAKQHLIDADPRFEDLFSKMKCRPFEHLESVDPFRTLATSILGQQISWLAARSIAHRFIRLFDPSLPEKPLESGSSSNMFFPSAQQVSSMDIATLRTAGLSGRKAEYVQDLATRFADGRLSNDKILQANDEELYEMLIAVRGIGKWTVDMFAIFSLRRPNILPVGDLGVQRGVARWILSLHSPKHPYTISPRKLPKAPTDTKDDKGESASDAELQDGTTSDSAPLMEVDNAVEEASPVRALTPDAAAFPPAPLPSTPVRELKRNAASTESGINAKKFEVPAPPLPFTPSINRTLNKTLPTNYEPPSLPLGLSVKEIQTRLDGKKKIKGALLTPNEMEELTEIWKPYRSLGVFYMWALAEGDKS